MTAEDAARARALDGRAGDADYGVIGTTYDHYRVPDPRIARAVLEALDDSQTVLNVGAGAGSYEPLDRNVTAVEPSASMRSLRPRSLPPALEAVAEELPFADDSFEASMTTFSVHQWADLAAGLKEMRRVTRGPVVILTCDPALLHKFWLTEYAPEVIATEQRRYPSIEALADGLGGTVTVKSVPIPVDCSDGFNEAYYARPEQLLVPEARQACSAWSFVDSTLVQRYTDNLANDLGSGIWDQHHGSLRTQPFFDGSLVLVRATRN
jgi:SAM-dependent methyltransferase